MKAFQAVRNVICTRNESGDPSERKISTLIDALPPAANVVVRLREERAVFIAIENHRWKHMRKYACTSCGGQGDTRKQSMQK